MMIPTAFFKKMFLFTAGVVFLAGCAEKENNEAEEASLTPVRNEKAAVAAWEEKGAAFYDLSRMLGDKLYFVEMKWDESTKKSLDAVICRKQRGQEPEQLTHLRDTEFICYTVDEGGAVYALYTKEEGGEQHSFLRKVSAEGEVIYDTPFSAESGDEEQALSRLETVSEGEADEMGRACFANTSGDLYLFDETGKLACVSSALWDENTYGKGAGLVNVGEDGIFAYAVDERKLSLQKVDMTDGSLGSTLQIKVDTSGTQASNPDVQTGTVSMELFSGYERGVLISDSDALWGYRISDEELMRILGWGDSMVNLKNYSIEALGVLTDGSLYLRACRSREDRGNVSVVFKDASELQEKQKVTLAGTAGYEHWNTELENMISAFNQANTEYEAELLTYESDFELNMALLKGEGPDVIDLSRLDMEIFARKGILEDLSPCFEKSEVVQEADLVPSVLRAGTVDEKLVSVFPCFCVRGFWVEKGTTENGGWTAEDYIALAENHPDAVMQDYGSPSAYHSCVFSDAIKMDMDSYVNWEEKECYFDSDRFISLINRVKNLPLPASSDLVPFEPDSIDRVQKKFRNHELLVDNFSLGSITTFRQAGNDAGDFAEIAGYPNRSGEPKYELYGVTPLGINSASRNKEGAWAFLEYILSEQYQSEVIELSPRQERFEEQLAMTEAYGGYLQIDLTKEERDFIREMVDNAYYCTGELSGGELKKIISEELQPVWAGDKTAEEAVKIIQGRATLLINE